MAKNALHSGDRVVLMAKYLRGRTPAERMTDLDDACQRAVDAAHAAYEGALREGTARSLATARDAVSHAWGVLVPAHELSADKGTDPCDAAAAAVLLQDEGKKLLSVDRAVHRLSLEIEAGPSRVRRARSR